MNIVEAINSGKKFTADCEASRFFFEQRKIKYLYWDKSKRSLLSQDKYSKEPYLYVVKDWKLKPYRSVEDEVGGRLAMHYGPASVKIIIELIKPYLKEEL